MAKLLFYGGSFDPIHFGHLRCSQAMARAGGFGTVVLIPCAQSPHKSDPHNNASAIDRLAMCKLAAREDEIFQVDDIEIQRGGPSYTIDTIGALKARGLDEIHWLIGADQLPALPQWHQPRALVDEANLIVMHRAGYAINWPKLPQWMQILQKNVVDVPPVEISSTDIRQKVSRGESIEGLVPVVVEEYIEARGLYRV